MSQEFDNLDENGWNQFEVLSHENQLSGETQYENFKLFKSYFDMLPKAELIDRGWIESKDDVLSLVDLFSEINSFNAGTLFRKNVNAETALISLWLSKVRTAAKEQMMAREFPVYKPIGMDDLAEIAKLSADVSNLGLVQEHLAGMGIILIYLRALPNMKLDGAVFRSPAGNPVIGMSLRYSRLDNFWFTLLHELAHVVLHIDLLEEPILDDLDEQFDSDIEVAADRLALSSFVSRSLWRNCEPKYKRDEQSIREFADQVGVHPSIVAGRLARETGNYALYSGILNGVNVREVIFGKN